MTKMERQVQAKKKKLLGAARRELARRYPTHDKGDIMSGGYDQGPAMARVLADMRLLSN